MCWREKKIVCSGGKFKRILNSSEKVFYGGDTKFSYTACQWIEEQAIETGKYIHRKMCGHGGERMVEVWALNNKGKKEPVSFLVDRYEPETNSVSISWMPLARAYIHKRPYKKTTKEI